jgi:uncharacterized repeat protein (TIGR01451 family)
VIQRMARLILGLCLASPLAYAQGTITDAPASFALNAATFDASPSANLTGVSTPLTQDHLYETGWWYRIQGDGAEKFFPVPTSQTYVGNLATLSWTNVDARGFDAQLVYRVVNQGGPSGYVTGQLILTNPGASALSIDVFNMVDFDLQPTAANDSATLVTANNDISITDPAGNTARYRGVGANAFLVRPYGATDLGAVLGNAAVDNFANTGLPFGPGDFTAGFQWTTVSIPGGGQQAYAVILAVNGAGPSADLGITVADGTPSYYPGQTLAYTITVTNVGPDTATGAPVTDTFPADLMVVSWTCTASAGSACASPNGLGNIQTTVDLLSGGTATFTATVTASPASAGSISNTATVGVPGAIVDPDLGNNSSTDLDTRLPTVDLSITKSDGKTSYFPGEALTYTIVAANAGPDAAVGATVIDTLPADLSNVSWSCAASAGSACGALSGTGPLNTTADLLVGGTATYSLTATASLTALASLTNTASVAVPAGLFDFVSANDSATDTDARTGGSYYTVAPCRIVDTRLATGPWGGPALVSAAARTFTLAGQCGVPANATAVSLTITATEPTAPGFLQILPTGVPVSTVSSINYGAGQTRANNGVFSLGAGGEVDVRCGQASGSVQFIIDVSGYFIE